MQEHLVVCSLTMKHTSVVSLNARQTKPGVHLVDTTQWTPLNEHTTKCSHYKNISSPQVELLQGNFSQALFRRLDNNNKMGLGEIFFHYGGLALWALMHADPLRSPKITVCGVLQFGSSIFS